MNTSSPQNLSSQPPLEDWKEKKTPLNIFTLGGWLLGIVALGLALLILFSGSGKGLPNAPQPYQTMRTPAPITEAAEDQLTEEELQQLLQLLPTLSALAQNGDQAPSFEPAPTPMPTPLPPTPTPTPNNVPSEVPVPPAGPSASVVSLNYDESNSDPLTPGQSELVAVYLREAMKAGATQMAMEWAFDRIREEARAAGATVLEGTTLTLPRTVAWLVWCRSAEGVSTPTDIADIMGPLRNGPGMFWVVIPFAPGVPPPPPESNTFSGCQEEFWAVAVH